jgi:photosystem II stability/assembly factor-like uncharacterized protein
MKHTHRRILAFFLIVSAVFVLLITSAIAAQKPKESQKTKEAAKPAAAAPAPVTPQVDYAAILKTLRFREIGPAAMGGRIDDFAVVENDPDTIYVGSASGGVFKTVNGGTTWEPVFDNESVSTIGDLAIAPSDPSNVWVGTGEANNRQSSSWGDGVYKSTDAGRTWQHMGLAETQAIGRIVIHPTDPNTVYVAAVGRLWGPSKERGVYKTTDGGKTWTQVLFVNEDTGVSDIAMDPESPGTLIAAAYQRRRTVFGFNGSGPGSGLYKTTDGGATWKKLERGLPWDTTPRPAVQAGGPGMFGGGGGGGGRGPGGGQQAQPAAAPLAPEAINEIGRIGVNFYRRDSRIVYALIEHAGGGIFRSEDKGETWVKQSDTNPRAMYYSQVHIDPNNDQRLWVHGAQMFFSDDGGRTFRQNVGQRIHGDFHAMWIDPRDSNHVITGSDGGIYITWDRGRSWDFVNTIPLGQFYEIGLDMQKPYHICGGLQDNNAWCGPSATLDSRGIANSDWFTVGGGDGFYAQVDPTDPDIVYAESQDGNVLRRNLRTHESKSIRPPAPEGERYRFQWNSPILVSSFDPKTIYYGGNYLFKSTDRGDNWTRLGADLTTGQERDKLPIMGKVPDRFTLSRHDGVQEWPAITTVSESPANKNVLWVGTDDGNLQVTRDGGQNWKNVAALVKGVPKGTYVSRVTASRYADGTAYAAFDGHRSNDFNIYVYMTTDFGETWKPIREGLPAGNDIVHVIREHFRNPKLLFLGTERGLFVSFDQGARWTRFKANLPTVPVDDIAIHPRENDLVLGTHGRSIWILDDITPLEQMTDAVAAQDLQLFDVRPATEWRIANRGGSTGHKIFLGQNPPNGALINYYLKTKLGERDRVRITITDAAGKTIRDLNGTKEAGFNRVVWDLRMQSPLQAAAAAEAGGAAAGGEQTMAFFGGGGGGFGGGGGALRVEPGEYTVKLAIGNNTLTKKVVVEEDPRINISAEDRAARRQALDQLTQMATTAVTAQRSITGLQTSLNTFIEGYKRPGAPKPPENIQKAAEELLKKVQETCKKFASAAQCGERPTTALGAAGPSLAYTPPPIPNRITQILGALEGFTAAPTTWQLNEMKLLQTRLAETTPAVRALVQDELPKLNQLMRDAAMPYITVPGLGRPAMSTAGGEIPDEPNEP